jgi:glycosyltransferase involved in cell wall biosynthesis
LDQERRSGPLVTLHLNTESGMRGGEIQNLALARRLAASGVEAVLLARTGSPLHRRAADEGLRALEWNPRGELDLLAAMRLRRLVKGGGFQIVHAHTAHALTLALTAGAGLRGVHTVASRRVSFPLRSRLSRWKYGAADAVVAVSDEIREGLIREGLDPRKVRTIHSGVDLDRFRGLPSRQEARAESGVPEGAAVVGVVGALVPHKGHSVLIRALGGLRSAHPGLLLVLAGEGPLRESLEREASGHGLPVRFMGYVEEPAPLYAAMDLLVLPSLSGEGSPGAIKEAAAAGVPVISTDVGGAGAILRDGREALVVPPGDAGALAGAVRRLLEDGPLASELASKARERVRLFSIEAMAGAHLALYREMVSTSSST